MDKQHGNGPPPAPKTTALSVVLALIPALGLTLGIPFANRIEPRLFGLPFLPAYIVIWILLTPAFMFTVYRSEHRA
jgi:hypothetical protein